MPEKIIQINGLVNQFGPQVVHDHLDLEVNKGEILGIVGGSGSGKTVLLNTILGLHRPKSGNIKVFGKDVHEEGSFSQLRWRWGVLYQEGALFSSLTVAENIELPMLEIANIPKSLAEELVLLKLQMMGLEPYTANKYPSELSGGMVKRVSLARALAIDAEVLFLDEPTAGLDPIAASSFDKLIKVLQGNLNLTVVMITHDLNTLHAICDRIAVLVDKRIIIGSPKEIQNNPHPWIQSYFKGERGREVFKEKDGHKS